MNLRINTGVCTHVGQVRDSNEDNFFLNGSCLEAKGEKKGFLRCCESENSVQLYAVFDGMGGQKAGDEASALGASLMSNLLNDLRRGEDVRIASDHYTALVNDAVTSLKQGAGSTIAMLCIKEGVAYVAWLGDSRVYLLRDGELTQLTQDHTEEQRMKKLGIQSTDRSARNSLTRYLGMDMPGLILTPSYTEGIPLKKQDVFLLCTDGLTNLVDDKKIVGMLETAKIPERELAGAALKAGGTDNVTVMVIDLIQFRKSFLLPRLKKQA